MGFGKNLIDRPLDGLLRRERSLGIERITDLRPGQGGFERRLSIEHAARNMEQVAEEEIKATALSLGAENERPRPAIGSNGQKHLYQRRWIRRTSCCQLARLSDGWIP